MMHFYPLKFDPILKKKIWGGNKLITLLHKNSTDHQIGESWEISGVDAHVSVITNGAFKGKSLRDIIRDYPIEILGSRNYKRFGKDFPLLIKFIDAKKDLSIQLHPDDDLAKERHQSFGKTEMWYVMQADKNANLIVGFNKPMTKELYLKHQARKTLTEILNRDKVTEGDTYFIESGRVHAIGAGVLLAEIQQTSDITYRVYDWERVDEKGNYRELHTDMALEAIKFDLKEDFRVSYEQKTNASNPMVSCPFFTTNFIKLTDTIAKKNTQDSFIIYICVDGSFKISGTNFQDTLNKGETLLLPATVKNYSLKADSAKLLEVYI